MQIQQYLARIKAYRNYSDWTAENYESKLKEFNAFILKKTNNERSLEDTEKLQVRDVEDWMFEQIKKWKTARTCNLKLICIRNFLKYAELHNEKVIKYWEIILMKESKRKIEALSDEDEEKLFKFMQTDASKDDLTRIRDLTIVSIFINTWIRVSELCNIKIKDVKKELQIMWKNNHPRIVYLFDEILSLINLYLDIRKENYIESEYLFCSHLKTTWWKKLTRQTIDDIIRIAWKKAGLSESVWPHKLRHTFATKLLRRWWNIFYIKELLWHASLTTTQTYLTATNQDIKVTQNLIKEPWLAIKDEELKKMIQKNKKKRKLGDNNFDK